MKENRGHFLTDIRQIRKAIDSFPGGICFAALDGRPILVNATMNRLCYWFSGQTITNAQGLWKMLGEHAETELSGDTMGKICLGPENTAWRFQKKLLSLTTHKVEQITADNITEWYLLQNKWRQENHRLLLAQERRRRLLEEIVKSNEEEEILQAKEKIHNRFGELLFSSRQILKSGEGAEILECISDWNILIEDLENAFPGEDSEPSPLEELTHVSQMVGCSLRWEGILPPDRERQAAIAAAVREAITNAVKHASATEVTVSIQVGEAPYEYHVIIKDNGNVSASHIRGGSGLNNLKERLQKWNIRLNVYNHEGVYMEMDIP